MAAIIANISAYDIRGVLYNIDIYHLTDTTPLIQFDNLADLRRIDNGPGIDPPIGVYSSHYQIIVMVENSTQENLINIIVGSYENDIYCKITRAGTFIFAGYLLPEIITRPNKTYKFKLNLTFTDSLGKAGEVDYDPTVYSSGYYGIHSMLRYCLQSLQVDDLYGTTDEYMKLIKGLIPDSFTPVGDIYAQVCLSVYGFYPDSEDKNHAPVKVKIILEELCKLCSARFYYFDGIYVFDSVDARINATMDWYMYTKTLVGTASTAMANPKLTIDDSVHRIVDGSTISYLPALKSVISKYDTRNSNLLQGYLFDAANYTTIQDIAYYLLKAPATYLLIKLNYKELVTSLEPDPTLSVAVRYKYKATIKVGAYYLLRPIDSYTDDAPVYGNTEWSLTAGFYYFHSKKYIGHEEYDNGYYSLYIIQTPILEADGNVSFLVELEGLVELDGTAANPLDVTDTENTNVINIMNVFGESGDMVLEVGYSLLNNAGNSKVLEFNRLFLDYPDNNQRFAVRWNNNDGTYSFTDGWTVVGESPAVSKSIQVHNLRSIIQLMQSPREKHSLNVRHTESYFHPYYLITIGSADYMITRLDFDVIKAQSALDCLQLSKGTNEPSVTNTDKKDQGVSNDAGLTSIINEESSETSTSDEGIKTTAAIATGAVATVLITAMTEDLFEGDTLKIYSPSFRQYLLVTLTANCFKGSTSMSVSGTAVSDYLTGSLVIPDPRPQFKEEKFTGVVTNYVVVTITTLPDELVLSESAMRRKVRVKNNGFPMEYVHAGSAKINYNDFSSENASNRIYFSEALSGNIITVQIEN